MTEHDEGRWALVLGASGGTGTSVARALARDPGLHVFGVHRGNHPKEAAALVQDVGLADRRCHLRCGDAGTAEGAARGAEEVLAVAGPGSVRLFVHAIADASYGRFVSGPGERLHPRQVEKTFDCMAHSFVYWAQELLARDLLAPGARLVALTNPFADSCANGWGLIAATKAALEIYVRQLALELGPRGLCTCIVKFGMVETRAIRIAFGERGWERLKKTVAGVTPNGRLATTDEVARLISFLCRKEAEWFNGATIDFTGGQAQSLIDPLFNPRQREEEEEEEAK